MSIKPWNWERDHQDQKQVLGFIPGISVVSFPFFQDEDLSRSIIPDFSPCRALPARSQSSCSNSWCPHLRGGEQQRFNSVGTELEKPGLGRTGRSKEEWSGKELGRNSRTRLPWWSGGVPSLAAGLIAVLFRQELQLLHPIQPGLCLPRVLCLGKNRELREEPARKNGRRELRTRQKPKGPALGSILGTEEPHSPQTHSHSQE